MFRETLKEGDSGLEVVVLKIYLFGAGLGNGFKPDQLYDDATFCAVAQLRKRFGLSSVGHRSGDLDSEIVSAMKSQTSFDFRIVCEALFVAVGMRQIGITDDDGGGKI